MLSYLYCWYSLLCKAVQFLSEANGKPMSKSAPYYDHSHINNDYVKFTKYRMTETRKPICTLKMSISIRQGN